MSRAALLILLALAAPVISGCDTTKAKSERAGVAANRELESRKSIVVKKVDPRIDVKSVEVVGRGRDATFVVKLVNTSDAVLTDLPITVGVSRNGKRKQLNRAKGLDYFLTHVPAAAPDEETVWVAPLDRRVPSGEPFALVGKPALDHSSASSIPNVEIKGVNREGAKVTGEVKNATGFPQYVILVNVIATNSDGQVVAAGRQRLVKFATGESQEFSVTISGKVGKAELSAVGVPAIIANNGVLRINTS